MGECIMAGVDVHDANLLVKFAVDKGEVETRHIGGGSEGHERLERILAGVRKQTGAKRVVVAYEASGAGLGLYECMIDAGFECHQIAPSCMPRSQKQKRQRNDDRDALALLEQIRGHVLAGNNLYDVWIPDMETRDDREVVRARIDAKSTARSIKAKIQMLLKRHGICRPDDVGKAWTKSYLNWLQELCSGEEQEELTSLKAGARLAIETYVRQLKNAEQEVEFLNAALETLAKTPRYKPQVDALASQIKGVSTYTAMVFLAEVGDMTRFSNRRQIASFLGLCPTSDESGEGDDKKGHITRCGPGRVRASLCQSAWSAVRWDANESRIYANICERNPRHKKIGVVAIMRRLSIRMWHIAKDMQPEGIYDKAQKPTQRRKDRRNHRRSKQAATIQG